MRETYSDRKAKRQDTRVIQRSKREGDIER